MMKTKLYPFYDFREHTSFTVRVDCLGSFRFSRRIKIGRCNLVEKVGLRGVDWSSCGDNFFAPEFPKALPVFHFPMIVLTFLIFHYLFPSFCSFGLSFFAGRRSLGTILLTALSFD